MAEPKGKIVARPMVVRACGHEQEFQHYEVDKFRAQRLAKFQQTRCATCVAKQIEEEQRQAAAMPSKAEVIKRLPAATQVTLLRQEDGSWSGTLSANGMTVNAAGIAGAGPESVIVAMARLWLAESGNGGTK
jgi:hypothetical protein